MVLFMAIGRHGLPWWYWFVFSIPLCCCLIFGNRWPVILLIVGLCSAGWSGLHRQKLVSHDLMLMTGIDQDRALVHLQGRIIGAAGKKMQIDLTHWLSRDDPKEAWGRLVVSLPSRGDPDLIGREVRIKGWIRMLHSSETDAEPDWISIGIDGDYRGWMSLESWDLLEVMPIDSMEPRNIRPILQRWVTRRILAPPVTGHGQARSLLSALLLGQRDHEWKQVSLPFQRLGVSHLLAISGMHLALVASMVMLAFRFTRGPRTWHWMMVLVTIVLYMMIVEERPPIVRAGIMSITAIFGIMLHRRLSSIGLLAMAAILILVVQPGQLSRPGFQLSFLVVSGLLMLGPSVLHRDRISSSTSHSLLRRLCRRIRQAWMISLMAWLVSVPLVLFHFKQFSIVAVPMTLLLMMPVCLIMFLGITRVLLFWVPGLSEAFGHGMTASADWILSLVGLVDSTGWFTIEHLETSMPWTLSATAWVVAWGLLMRRRNILYPLLLVLVVWIVIQQLPAFSGC